MISNIINEMIQKMTLEIGTYRTFISLDLTNNEIISYRDPIRMQYGRGWGIQYWVKSLCGDWVSQGWKDFKTLKKAKEWIKNLVPSGKTVIVSLYPDNEILRMVKNNI